MFLYNHACGRDVWPVLPFLGALVGGNSVSQKTPARKFSRPTESCDITDAGRKVLSGITNIRHALSVLPASLTLRLGGLLRRLAWNDRFRERWWCDVTVMQNANRQSGYWYIRVLTALAGNNILSVQMQKVFAERRPFGEPKGLPWKGLPEVKLLLGFSLRPFVGFFFLAAMGQPSHKF